MYGFGVHLSSEVAVDRRSAAGAQAELDCMVGQNQIDAHREETMLRQAVVATRCVVAFIAISALSSTAVGQDYPSRPLRIIVGFAASGGADVAARLVAHRLTDALGQNVIVENRPDMKKALQKLGAESRTTSPKEYAALIRRDLAENSKMVRAAGLAAPAPK